MTSSANQEFAHRLQQLMTDKGWSQSDLAREAGLSRQDVSTYVRGRSRPSLTSLHKMAKVFGMTAEELYPQYGTKRAEEAPSLHIKSSVNDPNKVHLQINRLVSMKTAVEIARLLNEDAL